ncbi:hypothetical protein KY290_033851 [Solanum tuberosum]|uniref:Retrovirus-related Pol polyprotein from transposon TNT 1-94-like beta-barrel domain-containing protein n=1 Tax=Solanum tuberosum TaxID=4113 RepID=A0ABQ7U3B8_SOLTU|nr:hypothetical protein KY290_033851 [Solanum tuberosum]
MERTKTKGNGVIIAKNIGTPVKRVGRFIGKPLNWKKNRVDDRGFQSQNGATNFSRQGNNWKFCRNSFNLHNFMQMHQILLILPVLLLKHTVSSAFLSVNSNQIDSGASDHMTGSSRFISTYTPCAGNSKIKIADGSFSAIAGKGTIKLSPSLVLHDTLHVPKLSCNLVSEKVSGKMISSARESGGLYFLDNGNNSLQLNPICLNFELYFCFE